MRYGAKTVIVVSYADFITLLFAFFVALLFVFSGGQAQDLQHQVPLSNSEPMPFANVQAVENVERSGDMERRGTDEGETTSFDLVLPDGNCRVHRTAMRWRWCSAVNRTFR